MAGERAGNVGTPADELQQRLAYQRKMRRRRKKEREAEEEAITSELNITAMMDMMTILLVFLLKSFGSDSANITLDEHLMVPQSTSALRVEELVTVTITSRQILVGDKAVVELESTQGADGKPMAVVPAGVRDNGGRGMLIVPVEEQLRKEIEKIREIAEYNPSMQPKNQISIVGDANTPYDVLTMVLYTAGKVGLDGYKFVVIGANQG